MHRFFRQIQQRLSNDNRFGSYLRLHILEIALFAAGMELLVLSTGCQFRPENAKEIDYNLTRIWTGTGADFDTGDVSEDGIYFSDIDWDNGHLKLVNLKTGMVLKLTQQGYAEGGFSWTSAFSSGGDRLAYAWYDYDTESHALRVFSFTDSIVRTILAADEGIANQEPLDWTPDDKAILIARQYTGSHWELGFVTPVDGQYDPIISLEWNAPGGIHPFAYPNAELSPNGNYIGFGYRPASSSSNDLFLVSVKEGRLLPLLTGEGEDHFLAWRKDGNQILFYSDRSGNPALWTVDVRDGERVGDPRLIVDSLPGLSPIGASEEGYLFGLVETHHNVHIAAIDLESGEILQHPKPVVPESSGRNSVGDWSADGRYLAYIHFPSLPEARESVIVHSMEGNGSREVFFPWNFHNKTGTVSWYSDNNILIDGNSPGYSGIHSFDLRTGEVTIPANFGKEGFFQRFKTNADGSHIYVEMHQEDPGLVIFDTETGSSERLLDNRIIPNSTAVSQDESKLVFLQRDTGRKKTRLRLMDYQTREVTTIIEESPGVLSPPVTWTSDAGSILVGVTMSENEMGLWRINPNQPTNRLFIPLQEVVNRPMVLSADGMHVAFQNWEDVGSIYRLEGF